MNDDFDLNAVTKDVSNYSEHKIIETLKNTLIIGLLLGAGMAISALALFLSINNETSQAYIWINGVAPVWLAFLFILITYFCYLNQKLSNYFKKKD